MRTGSWIAARLVFRLPAARRRAFGLVELLVAIAIIGILAGLLLPAVQNVRAAARRTQCLSQLKQLSLAMLHYEESNRHFAPGFSNPEMTMWSAYLLPFVEQTNLYRTMDLNARWLPTLTTHPENLTALGTVLEIFQCPSAAFEPGQFDPWMGAERVASCYLACASGLRNRESGPLPWCGMTAIDGFPASDGIFYMNSETRRSKISDGSSTTILLGETLPDQFLRGDDYSGNSQKADHWIIGSGELSDWPFLLSFGSADVSECLGSSACPLNAIKQPASPINDKELSFGSNHATGTHLGFADGHVRFVNENIDRTLYSALGSRGEGEIASFDD